MQARAIQAGTTVDDADERPDPTERRPVRAFVRTVRTDDFYLPTNDTLCASDLGITRRSTNKDLAQAAKVIAPLIPGKDPQAYVRYLRDWLATPRDVEEAHDWGWHIDEQENFFEFSDDPKKRRGWFWVDDPRRTETQQERETRLFTDWRILDTYGLAAL